MKKKEVTWADFGENDKITEEVLGLKRVPKNIYVKDSYSLGTIVAFLFLILDFVTFFPLSSAFLFMSYQENDFSYGFLVLTIISVLAFILGLQYINYLHEQKYGSYRKNLKNNVKPVKGKIVEIIKYKNVRNWTVVVEFCDDVTGRTFVLEGCSFSKNISQYLRTNKVNVYIDRSNFYKDIERYLDIPKKYNSLIVEPIREINSFEVADFDFRNRDNPKKADIPMYQKSVYIPSDSGGD